MAPDPPQDIILRQTLWSVAPLLRKGQRGRVVDTLTWDEDGRTRTCYVADFGGRLIGIWPHEGRLAPVTADQAILAV